MAGTALAVTICAVVAAGAGSRPAAGGAPPVAVAATDGHLLVHRADGALEARDQRTGGAVWSNHDLAATRVETARLVDDTLVVIGRRTRGSTAGAPPADTMVAGLDPDTGALRWQRTARSASLAADGTAVLASGDGQLQAITPAGRPRWQHPPATSEVTSVEATGHLIAVGRGDGGEDLHRLHDGTPLDQPGRVLASDDEHTLLARPTAADQAPGAAATTGQFVLLDARGREVWRAAGTGRDTCIQRAEFRATAVEVRLCHGGTVGFHRTQGFVLARPPVGGSGRQP